MKDSTRKLWGRHEYRIGPHIVPLSKTLAWCNQCASLQPVEDFSDRAEVLDKIRRLEQLLSEHLGSTLSLFNDIFYRRSRQQHHKQLLQLTGLMHRLDLIHNRRGHECCLSCGSSDLLPFNANLDLAFNEETGQYSGQKYTDFAHPGCEGVFIASADYSDPPSQLPIRQYAIDGSIIETIY